MRLIDADLVVEKAMKIINESLDSDFLEDRLVADEVALFLAEFIANAPTVDVEPVRHGKWIEHKWAEECEGLLISNYECSKCSEWVRDETDYCPNCGAKMDGDMNAAN